ncbi:MAG: hypothetical protein [Olavius algarvensis Gamma 3 endosymbiont]|nr:MAG: hypothetical protein [Olavius algarvensis Gamma 3 endosymbiont]
MFCKLTRRMPPTGDVDESIIDRKTSISGVNCTWACMIVADTST